MIFIYIVIDTLLIIAKIVKWQKTFQFSLFHYTSMREIYRHLSDTLYNTYSKQ